MNIKRIIDDLSNFVTEERFSQFNSVLNNRTRYITVAIEDIYQPYNASAILRTADCFGIQDINIIENNNKYDINPDVALGSYKWINLIKHNELENNTISAINYLREKGYRIVATTPHTNDVNLEDFDISKGKTALFFGTELLGLSDLMLKNADEFLKIPMYGFTESFNISVSASIILHHLTSKLHKTNIDWQLTENEKDTLMLKWLLTSIKRSDVVLRSYCKNNSIRIDDINKLLNSRFV